MVFDTVREILAHQLEVDPQLISMDTDIIDDLGADSLDVVELIMAIEEEYDIVITDEGVSNMTRVGQVVEYLDKIL
jgi:acyl carrier protein